MIKLLTSISGVGFSANYGEEIELDNATEERLIESGQAERVVKAAKPAAKKTFKKTKTTEE